MIKFDNLVKEFREEYLEEVGYNYSTTHIILSSLFKGIRDAIHKGDLPEIRIKYLGIFKVAWCKVNHFLGKSLKDFESNTIIEEEFLEKTEKLIEFIEKTPDTLKNPTMKQKYLKVKDYVRNI